MDFLNKLKNKQISDAQYESLINKAIIGLSNNTQFDFNSINVIIYPQSSSKLNFDLANKIASKLPNCIVIKDSIIKNLPQDIQLDYSKLNGKSQELIDTLEDILKNIKLKKSDFKIKYFPPRYRKFVINFLKLKENDRRLINLINNGNVLVVDDIITEGTTFTEVFRLLKNYNSNTINLYSLLG